MYPFPYPFVVGCACSSQDSTTSVEGMPLPRGPWNDLHTAARDGLSDRTVVRLLASGLFDINQGNENGATPVMIASFKGHSRVVRLLLNKGASVSGVDDDGFTALHSTAEFGRLEETKLLVEAGADLEAKTSTKGSTPLHIAAQEGFSEVMKVLLEAGANLNSRAFDGSTPLYRAAVRGSLDAANMLLRGKANPLLTARDSTLPLVIAANCGHSGVVHELIQQCGLEGCAGTNGGVDALEVAAQEKHLEVMATLTNAGVVDTGVALLAAADCSSEGAVRFLLLQQMKWTTTRRGQAVYLNTLGPTGQTPLLAAIHTATFSSCRIVRLLVDAGADAASPVRLTNDTGKVFFYDTALALTIRYLVTKNIVWGKAITEDQLHSLEATRRLLLRLEAVHAASWLWVSCSDRGAAGGTQTTTVALALPTLRQRTRRPRVLFAAIFRYSTKP